MESRPPGDTLHIAQNPGDIVVDVRMPPTLTCSQRPPRANYDPVLSLTMMGIPRSVNLLTDLPPQL
jgi:hypothetical protein